ncbi:hypothetical protein C1H46_017954 [Malus baccata]|uniref:Uncharacterized protein n=1 Tax=Malus baccata TaxID=106549 RepID=A0A540MDE9_MALBA|nr:hypothetical protein C1H46_017954 [Malus baccata]
MFGVFATHGYKALRMLLAKIYMKTSLDRLLLGPIPQEEKFSNTTLDQRLLQDKKERKEIS